VIAVRAPADPQRAPRQRGADKAPHLSLRRQGITEWRASISDLLADGKARTFNAICVILSGLTADICLDEVPEHALWSLVEQSRVEFTLHAPILFRTNDQR